MIIVADASRLMSSANAACRLSCTIHVESFSNIILEHPLTHSNVNTPNLNYRVKEIHALMCSAASCST